MKYVVIPNQIEELNFYNEKGIDTFIIGLEHYSINYPTASLERIQELSQKYTLFVSVNKNIFNSELEDVKKQLIELSKLPIQGILFYDLGILNIVQENKIPIDLVWHQTHMVTNYNSCNYYYEKGVKTAFLANEITLEEILEIKEKSKIKCMVEIFGYPIMSHSRRKLLTNYMKSIGKEKENRTYLLKEHDNTYRLKETEDGASILLGKLMNGTKPLFALIQNQIDYLVLDMQEVDREIGEQVIDTYLYLFKNIDKIDSQEQEKLIHKMNSIIGDYTNFFYQKTIYKVKKGESEKNEK